MGLKQFIRFFFVKTIWSTYQVDIIDHLQSFSIHLKRPLGRCRIAADL